MVQNFHEFHEKISHRENIIVNILLLHISALIVGYFFDTCLIREIKNVKSYFEAFRGNLVPQKLQTIQYVFPCP